VLKWASVMSGDIKGLEVGSANSRVTCEPRRDSYVVWSLMWDDVCGGLAAVEWPLDFASAFVSCVGLHMQERNRGYEW
jgi:hypothetical protein